MRSQSEQARSTTKEQRGEKRPHPTNQQDGEARKIRTIDTLSACSFQPDAPEPQNP